MSTSRKASAGKRHRLPSGKLTASKDRYRREWNKLVKALDTFFEPTGYKAGSCDPGVTLYSAKDMKAINLPVSVALHIVQRTT